MHESVSSSIFFFNHSILHYYFYIYNERYIFFILLKYNYASICYRVYVKHPCNIKRLLKCLVSFKSAKPFTCHILLQQTANDLLFSRETGNSEIVFPCYQTSISTQTHTGKLNLNYDINEYV